jgi:glyoxylase-like metal-dependent hydrolase (beta-lactamase superfamily II)
VNASASPLRPPIGLLVVAVLTGAAAAGAEEVPIATGLSAVQLADDAWVVTSDAPWPANILVVRVADGTVVVADTPPTEKWTAAVLDWIERRFAPPSIVAVNSHYHADATGGNRVLRERGVPIWGSALTAELVRIKGVGMLKELRQSVAGSDDEGLFDQSVLVEPDHLIPEGESRILDLGGGQQVVIVDPGPAHSPDNVVVWFPDSRILFGGCMVKASDSPGNLEEASLEHWPEALDRLRALGPIWVVPGHGQRFDPGILDLTEQVVRTAAADDGG